MSAAQTLLIDRWAQIHDRDCPSISNRAIRRSPLPR